MLRVSCALVKMKVPAHDCELMAEKKMLRPERFETPDLLVRRHFGGAIAGLSAGSYGDAGRVFPCPAAEIALDNRRLL
jgi:hypothetical protein